MKVAGLRGFVLMGFVEEHNHPLATGAANMFLRCNRNLSYAYQNFIMDCSRANIGPTRAHNLVKEMTGSFDNIGATVEDFKNFNRDVKSRIGAHDSDMILDRFKSNKAASKNSFYYDYKVDSEGRLTGLFWTDTVAQANYDVFGDIVSFDPTFRTNRYLHNNRFFLCVCFFVFCFYKKLSILCFPYILGTTWFLYLSLV